MDTKALRQKILDLAIRGKLVPQDPNDEPASVLLERIRAEKQQMAKDGKLKPKDIKNDTVIFKGDDNLHYEKFSDGTVKCIEFESDFDIPSNWAWCNLGLLFNHNTGKALNSANSDGKFLTYITTSNVYWDKFELKNLKTMPFTENEIDKFTVTKGDLLVCEGGDIGRSAIWNFDEEIRIQNHLHRLRPYGRIYTKFYYYIMYLYKANGRINGNGIGLQGLSSNALHKIIVPVPPIEEQKRIVNNITSVLSLLEQIESQKQSLSSQIDNIKSKILDLAIRGKLVPQDPNDEPASVLLERIRAEKEELIKQGKIKRDKKESVIFKGDDNSYYEKIGDTVTCIDDKIPFEIPESWCWTRLNHITINHDSYRKPINSSDRKNRIVGKKKSKLYPYYGATGQVGLIDDYLFDGEYILLGEDAAPFLDKNAQKAYMIIGKSWVNNHAHILKSLILSKYLTHCLNSINYLNYVYGTTRLKLTQENMNKILIPVPPFKEQQRLIHKIDFIMGSINQINLSNKSK